MNESQLILIVEDNDDDYIATMRAFKKANLATRSGVVPMAIRHSIICCSAASFLPLARLPARASFCLT